MRMRTPGGWYTCPQETAALSTLGIGLVTLAILLILVSDFALVGYRKKLGTWLAFGNLAIVLTALLLPTSSWGRFMGVVQATILLPMAGVLAWASRRPLSPVEAAAEFAALQIPDEIRLALLQQVSEAAAQEERNRLARDLHDSIKQQLFSINVGTATAQERWERDPEGARAALQDVRRSVREAMVEMQAMLHQLRPEALGSTGLIEALREQCEALGYRTGAEVSFELGEPIPDDRLPPGAQETLFRIAQEALGNVARHARARRVRVRLGREGDTAHFRVEDDGQGFETGKESSGMGLRNIKERTEPLGGVLDVVSTPGVGTVVRVAIPLLSPLVAVPEESSIKDEGLYLFFAGTLTFGALLNPAEPNTGLFQTVWDALGVLIFLTLTMMARQLPPEMQRNEPFRWRYALHRLRAVLLFAAAVQAPWYQRLAKEGLQGDQLAWMVIALPCLGLALRELALFHHWSEWGSSIGTGRRTRYLVAGGCLLAFLLILGNMGPSDYPSVAGFLFSRLEWLESLLLIASVVGTVYFFFRKPRAEGAAS
jgi:signal transduction histidine kinase